MVTALLKSAFSPAGPKEQRAAASVAPVLRKKDHTSPPPEVLLDQKTLWRTVIAAFPKTRGPPATFSWKEQRAKLAEPPLEESIALWQAVKRVESIVTPGDPTNREPEAGAPTETLP